MLECVPITTGGRKGSSFSRVNEDPPEHNFMWIILVKRESF